MVLGIGITNGQYYWILCIFGNVDELIHWFIDW